MKLLFLACLSPPTGNRTTAQRISEYIQSCDHVCALRDIADFKSSSQVSDLISEEKFEAVLIIHLYKGGRLLLGVVTKPCEKFDWIEFLQNSGIQCKNIDPYIFLLVCGLRQVKDPLFLVDAFSAWRNEEPRVYLIIIGPEVDTAFTQQVKAKVKGARGVYLVSEKPQEELHAAMRDSFAVVNSSISEGMSSTILEAMDLNVPVLARNIPGNRAIVKHENTGLLFFDPSEFVEFSKRLISDTCLKESIVTQAKKYVAEHHSWNTERETYRRLTAKLL
ncbi:glycosyltransferase 1 domain-containing protein 1 isoform X2 [Scyliorhinus torazame]|uniref:glycosyltransferase 1 domain-containing protein 1 isoform X2 n=1 Tax=Scyliorhinus torazame TaxID=75743 RepID=UPI003B5BD3DE